MYTYINKIQKEKTRLNVYTYKMCKKYRTSQIPK